MFGVSMSQLPSFHLNAVHGWKLAKVSHDTALLYVIYIFVGRRSMCNYVEQKKSSKIRRLKNYYYFFFLSFQEINN